MLTDAQIDRYSRQIILPEVGGVGQERLLAARVRILAETGDLSPALQYLTGAGIGTIRLDCPDGPGRVGELIAAAAELNPDVRLEPAGDSCGEVALVLAGSHRVIEAARRLNQAAACPQAVFARLGPPYLIAVLTSRPPCLACAAPGLLGPLECEKTSPLIAIAAAAELIKHLLAPAAASRMVEFSGYQSRAQELKPEPRCAVCKPDQNGIEHGLA